MRDFQFYIDKGEVKKVSADNAFAESLLKNIETRLKTLKKLDSKEDAVIFFETAYDCIREACDAILAVKGYKSYSHQASIIHLKKFGFDDSVINKIDSFRAKRNSSKYYGEEVLKEDSSEINIFLHGDFNKILKKAEELIGAEK